MDAAEVANVNLCVYDDGGACNNDGNTGAGEVVMADAVAAAVTAAQALRHSKLHLL